MLSSGYLIGWQVNHMDTLFRFLHLERRYQSERFYFQKISGIL